MDELQFLVDSDENIWEAELAETDKHEPCICFSVGDETKQFEICLTESQLEKMLSLCKE